jgi:hypothetical protein
MSKWLRNLIFGSVFIIIVIGAILVIQGALSQRPYSSNTLTIVLGIIVGVILFEVVPLLITMTQIFSKYPSNPSGSSPQPIVGNPPQKNPPNSPILRRRIVLLSAALVVSVGAVGVTLFATLNQSHIAQVEATATAGAYFATQTAANRDPYPPASGKLLFSDSLSAEQSSHWKNSSDSILGNSCQFSKGAYFVDDDSQSSSLGPAEEPQCYSSPINVVKFAFEVQMTIIKGRCGGFLFGDHSVQHFYWLEICEGGGRGFYEWAYVSDLKSDGVVGDLLSGDAVNGNWESNQTNIVAIVINGTSLDLYVNHNLDAVINFTTYKYTRTDFIAFTATSGATSASIVYRNARLWTF